MKAHAQKPELVFLRNGRVHLNRWGGQFSRLLAVEECGSAGKTTGYPLHSRLSPSLPLPCVTVCRLIPIQLYSISIVYSSSVTPKYIKKWYIYIYIYIYEILTCHFTLNLKDTNTSKTIFWRRYNWNLPYVALFRLFYITHTFRYTQPVGVLWTGWPVCSRGYYLHNTSQTKETSYLPWVEFERLLPTIKWLPAHALDRKTTRIWPINPSASPSILGTNLCFFTCSRPLYVV